MSEQFEKDLKRLEILRDELEKIGYFGLRVVEGRGICGIEPFIFTYGLCYGLDYYGREGRWCYEKKHGLDAVIALSLWDGKKDPAGRWIKYKGLRGEYSNPKFIENENN